VLRWFRELQHYGFIVMTEAGHLGIDGKGKAPHWRLTELGCGIDPPTANFRHWNGIKFRRTEKQNPGREIGARVAAKAGPPLVAKAGPVPCQTGREIGAIQPPEPGREIGAVTSITTAMPEKTVRHARPPEPAYVAPGKAIVATNLPEGGA
jgi:hypothetical protein